MNPNSSVQQVHQAELVSTLAGAGLTLASLILLPALAQRMGMGQALTAALRIALMKASHKV
jgi:hypothetical protein